MKRRERQKVEITGGRAQRHMAAGAGVALAAVASAEADITHVVVNTPVLDTTLDGSAVGVNLVFGDLASFNLGIAHGIGTTNAATGYAFTAPDGFFSPGVSVAGFTVGNYNYASKLGASVQVDQLTAFLNGTTFGTMAFNAGYTFSQWLGAGTGFLGVRFNTNAYGWVRITMNGAPLNSFTIVDYAWCDPGETMHVGDIPEPGSLGALALGALGLASWRRARRAA